LYGCGHDLVRWREVGVLSGTSTRSGNWARCTRHQCHRIGAHFISVPVARSSQSATGLPCELVHGLELRLAAVEVLVEEFVTSSPMSLVDPSGYSGDVTTKGFAC